MEPDDFKEWIGRSTTRRDMVTERLVRQFRATLAPYLFDAECPPGLHWCLAVPALAPENLGQDGAEEKGLFIPPIGLPQRMWAGGCIETSGAFHFGDEVERTSTIADVKWHDGASGRFCIVSVVHEFSVRGIRIVRERQDLLFRGGGKARLPPAPQQLPPGDLRWRVEATPLLLFRFSALTFNGHRIHYDQAYAREVEGHDGLLVHGPLQATLMLNQLAVAVKRVPGRFDYRCVAPLMAGQVFNVVSDKGNSHIVNAAGNVTLEASAK